MHDNLKKKFFYLSGHLLPSAQYTSTYRDDSLGKQCDRTLHQTIDHFYKSPPYNSNRMTHQSPFTIEIYLQDYITHQSCLLLMPCKFQSVLIKQDSIKKKTTRQMDTDAWSTVLSPLRILPSFFFPLDDNLDNVKCFLSTLIHVYKYVLSWMFAYFSCVFRAVLFIVNIYMTNYRTETSQITHLFVCSVLIFLSTLLWKFRFAFN